MKIIELSIIFTSKLGKTLFYSCRKKKTDSPIADLDFKARPRRSPTGNCPKNRVETGLDGSSFLRAERLGRTG